MKEKTSKEDPNKWKPRPGHQPPEKRWFKGFSKDKKKEKPTESKKDNKQGE